MLSFLILNHLYNRYGINGKFCVLRSVCEVKYLLSPKYEDIVEDFLRIFLE